MRVGVLLRPCPPPARLPSLVIVRVSILLSKTLIGCFFSCVVFFLSSLIPPVPFSRCAVRSFDFFTSLLCRVLLLVFASWFLSVLVAYSPLFRCPIGLTPPPRMFSLPSSRLSHLSVSIFSVLSLILSCLGLGAVLLWSAFRPLRCLAVGLCSSQTSALAWLELCDFIFRLVLCGFCCGSFSATLSRRGCGGVRGPRAALPRPISVRSVSAALSLTFFSSSCLPWHSCAWPTVYSLHSLPSLF